MGGSTLLAYNTLSIEKIVSVEHNFDWFKKISDFNGIKNEERKRIFLEYIDLGKLIKNTFEPKYKKIFKLFESSFSKI